MLLTLKVVGERPTGTVEDFYCLTLAPIHLSLPDSSAERSDNEACLGRQKRQQQHHLDVVFGCGYHGFEYGAARIGRNVLDPIGCSATLFRRRRTKGDEIYGFLQSQPLLFFIDGDFDVHPHPQGADPLLRSSLAKTVCCSS